MSYDNVQKESTQLVRTKPVNTETKYNIWRGKWNNGRECHSATWGQGTFISNVKKDQQIFSIDHSMKKSIFRRPSLNVSCKIGDVQQLVGVEGGECGWGALYERGINKK